MGIIYTKKLWPELILYRGLKRAVNDIGFSLFYGIHDDHDEPMSCSVTISLCEISCVCFKQIFEFKYVLRIMGLNGK